MIRNLIFLISFAASALASEITGTVTNKTVNRPASGDEVILLKLAQGMEEVARTRSDARGRFTLKFTDSSAPHLVRVNHGGVNYHRPAPPGTTSVEVDVYDTAVSVPDITQSVDVMRIEADATNLRVLRMFELNNHSSPPRTRMGQRTFEVALPVGAQVEQSAAAGPGGMPVNAAPVPTGEAGHYAFNFPLRPGETRFQIAYTLPYDGKLGFSPVLLQPVENFAVSVPKSMQLTVAPGSRLEAKGEDAGMSVFVAQNASPNQPLGFTVSGTGNVPLDDTAQGGNAPQDNRPGGGLGTPVNTPDPLYKYRWWIAGAVSLLFVAGAAYSLSRKEGTLQTGVPLEQAIKDELYRLETDRLQQRITAEDYAQARAALDMLMKRSLKP